MPNNDLANLTTTTSTIQDFSVSSQQTDGVSESGETYYDNDKFTEYFGYYKQIPELKKAIDALAIWVTGKGWETSDGLTREILEHLTGMGEDTFDSIVWNLLVTKLINGDAYAEIIRDGDEPTDTLINLKPLDPSSMRTVVDKKGRIVRYEQRSKNDKNAKPTKYQPHEIFHIMNDRVADEIHGTSVIEACKWVIDARNEAMADWRRISHRATIRVLYIDMQNTARLSALKTQYADAIKQGELLILPAKKGDAEFEELSLPPVDAFLSWIKYLENFFYQAVGIPKIILGGSEEFTEASSKIAYLTFEQVYKRHQKEFQDDFWNQVFLRVTFNEPASLRSEMLSSESKNTGQVGFQANDTTIGSGKA